MRFWKNLKERRIAQFLVTYCAGAWVVLQVVDQLVQNGLLPGFMYRAVFTFVLCAFPGALIVSWFHGAKGRQSMPAIEKWLLGAVAVLALSVSGFVARATLTAAPSQTGVDALPPDRDPRRLAVLYFDTRGGSDDVEFLAAGLTESLIDELSTVDALHVISKNGSQLILGQDLAADSIGRMLGVGTLVDGIVAINGERVRVDVEMIESHSGKQLQNMRIERPRADLFDLQDELGGQVAEFLRGRIGEEVGAIESRARTTVVEAWEQFQRAQQITIEAVELADANDLEGASREYVRADSLLAKAERLDPNWIELTVQRGWLAYRQARLYQFDRAQYEPWLAAGLEHAGRALARAPRNADALELHATLQYWRVLMNLAEDPARLMAVADSEFRAAIAINPRPASALNSLSHLLMRRGEITEAKLKAQQSYEADPFLQNANLTLWRLFSASWDLQDDQEARRWCGEGRRRFPEEDRFHLCQLMLYALPQQPPDLEDAWSSYQDYVRLSQPAHKAFNEKKGQMFMAMALVRAGMPDSASAVAIRARAGTETDPLRELAQLEAIVRTWLGEYDAAAERLALFISANPGQRAAFQAGAEQRQLPWYFEDLLDQERFRELLDVR